MKTLLLFICVVFLALSKNVYCQVRLPRLVRDSMVLQRDAGIKIWGWASPGEKVKIGFQNKKYKTAADANGNWMIFLSPMKEGGPYIMKIDATNHIVINNILIGDVWVCSGQSNMVHQMKLHRERYEAEIEQANYPEIRHFFIPTLANLQRPENDLPTGYWKSANPENVQDFSAVAYFFAKTVYEKYHIPIGLINASVGSALIESWTSEEGLKEFPAIMNVIKKNKDTAYTNELRRKAFENDAAAKVTPEEDRGLTGPTPWYDTAYTPKGWHNINIPGYWQDQGIKDLNGIVWYRKEINVPASMVGVPAKILMGRIVDADFLYVNGILAGKTTYQYPQRIYQLPGGLLRAGKNIIVIRVINNLGKGGFVPDKPYFLIAGEQRIDLKGDWQYKVGQAFTPGRYTGEAISLQNQPSALYNGMLAPLIPYAIKGFLWYQGESNISNASEYGKLLPALIKDWRNHWQQNNAPFLYVQLPNFGDVNYLPSESPWAVLREGQLKTLSVPGTGMAVAIDLGEWNDIHPQNKKDVGVRLALVAEKIAYGEKNVVCSGPIYQSSEIAGNTIIITFSNTGSGLVTNDGEEPGSFAVAGEDKKFFWAKAKFAGDKVVVWDDNITAPVYVRYAWADNPAGANLYNKEGLPASPFRTDK